MMHKIHSSRGPVLGLFLACFVLAACSCDTDPEGSRPRNVILISLDTVRQDRLTYAGHREKTSPTIDRLAREGTSFSNASASSPWTLPSHVSMLSGLYPHRHRVQLKEHGIPDDVETLATLLSPVPTATAGIVSSSVLAQKRGFGRGFDSYDYVSEFGYNSNQKKYIRNPGRFVTDKALQWLRQPKERPFFLFLHYYDAHSDYTPEKKYRDMFVDPYDGVANGSTSQLLKVRARKASFNDKDATHLKQLYDAEIRQVDDQLARIVSYLEETGLSKSTLVIVTSDHGEEFLEHGSVLHGRTYYEEVIRIPLILRGPGIPAGKTIDTPVNLVDISPTVLTLLGQPVPKQVQGMDLAQLWLQPEAQHRTTVLAEGDWMNELPAMYKMVRDHRFKLIYDWRKHTTQLYDLQADPLELQEISEKNPEVVKVLLGEMKNMMRSPNAPETRVELSEEEIRRLRSLGYVR